MQLTLEEKRAHNTQTMKYRHDIQKNRDNQWTHTNKQITCITTE